MNDLTDQIPGLKQAIERETASRNQSFLGLQETLCGVSVNPMTLRTLLLLNESGNVFVVGGLPTPADVGAFIVANSGKKGFGRWKLLRRIGKIQYEKAIEQIKAFMDETFQDAPASSGGKPTTSYFSSAAAIVDVMACEYGWAERDILDAPLKRLFQYIKAISKRNNPQAILFNPSDKIKGRYLAEINGN